MFGDRHMMNKTLIDEPVIPSEASDLLRRMQGCRIVKISSCLPVERTAHQYPGRLGGWTSSIELDSGEIVRFGFLDSVSALSVFLERDSTGRWLDDPPEDDEAIKIVGAGDVTGDAEIETFEGAMIERVEILTLARRTGVPFGEIEERGVLFGCAGGRELIFGIGLDSPTLTPDLPAVLLTSDLSRDAALRLRRRVIG